MKRSSSATSATDSDPGADNRAVECRLQRLSDELEYYKEVLDFRTCILTTCIAVVYLLQNHA